MKYAEKRKTMKKNLFTTFVLAVALAFGFQNISAQFTISLPKLPKIKKEKPSPENPGNTTNQEQSENKKSAGTGNELGTFYFSNQPFGSGTEGSKTSFTSGEFIYGRLVLNSGTVRNILRQADQYIKIPDKTNLIRFRVYRRNEFGQDIDMGLLTNNVVAADADLDKNYLDFDVFPQPEKAKSAVYSYRYNGFEPLDDIYLFLSKQDTKEGTYTMGVEITTDGVDFRGNPIQDNERKSIKKDFSFTFRSSDYAAIKANFDTLKKNFAEASTKSQTANQALPPEWSASPNRIPPAAETQLRTQYLSYMEDRNELKIIKFYSSAPGPITWSISTNDLGLITYRYSNQYYMVFLKNQAKKECSFDTFTLRQNYSGGGTYGQTLVVFEEGSRKVFDCAKLQ